MLALVILINLKVANINVGAGQVVTNTTTAFTGNPVVTVVICGG